MMSESNSEDDQYSVVDDILADDCQRSRTASPATRDDGGPGLTGIRSADDDEDDGRYTITTRRQCRRYAQL